MIHVDHDLRDGGPRSLAMGSVREPQLSAIRAAAAGQRLDPLNLFAGFLVEDGVTEVDVPV